jgi:hypothetical protein
MFNVKRTQDFVDSNSNQNISDIDLNYEFISGEELLKIQTTNNKNTNQTEKSKEKKVCTQLNVPDFRSEKRLFFLLLEEFYWREKNAIFNELN